MSLPKNTIPVAIGAAIGAAAISILSLTNGWVITSQKQQTVMEQANISVQASICASRAENFLKDSSSTAEMQGYQADITTRRKELARANATPLQGAETVDSNVIDACARLLNKPHS
ncbi:MAG: hypothetical protein WD075_12370 [Rhodospirillales bacterium]